MNIALMVGHYGKGTGASWTDPNGKTRDEWEYAWMDAAILQKMMEARGHSAHRIYVDRNEPRDKGLGALFSDRGGLAAYNIDIRAQWAIAANADVALELHYNSAENEAAKGHEVLIDDDEPPGSKAEQLATIIHDRLSKAYPLHPQRGVKRMRLRVVDILRRAGIPSCIVEPCFIFEPILEDRRIFTGPYYTALVDSLEEVGRSVLVSLPAAAPARSVAVSPDG